MMGKDTDTALYMLIFLIFQNKNRIMYHIAYSYMVCNLFLVARFIFIKNTIIKPRWIRKNNNNNKPAIAAMHGPNSLVRFGD